MNDTEVYYYISGPNFAGGLGLERREGKWVISHCPPYLRKMLAHTPVADIRAFLEKKGYRVERLEK